MPKRKKQRSKQRGSKRPRQSQAEKPDRPISSLEAKLPLEIQFAVLGYLEKKDLKDVRLVSQRWCSLVTPFLFDKIYISYRSLDLQTFTNCAAHPVISKAVKEVVYDVSYFRPDSTLEEYLERLTKDLSRIFYKQNPFECPNQQYQHYINAVISDPLLRLSDRDEFHSSHKNDDFVVEGYRIWQRHAMFEEEASRNGILLQALCYGFGEFVNLRSVIVENGLFILNRYESDSIDRSTLSCRYSGSPVTRGWNPLHARPSHKDNNPDNLDRHYQTIVQALDVTKRNTGRTIRDFRVLLEKRTDFGLPVTTLQNTAVDSKIYCASKSACANLKSFALRATMMNEGEFLSRKALGMFPFLLLEMEDLEDLQIDLQRRCTLDLPDHVLSCFFHTTLKHGRILSV